HCADVHSFPTRRSSDLAEAWEQFLSVYAGLLWAVIRRYMPARDREETHAVFAELLTGLYHHKFATYEGRAALSTWLTLVARPSRSEEHTSELQSLTNLV